MFYMLNMKGCTPRYYNEDEYDEAVSTYSYMKRHFANVSLVRVPYSRVVKDVIVTKRTI